jgi:2-iminobutanoate/2-iminopropanoate deaminase
VAQAISTPDAPKAIGPYSAALRVGSLLFISGQVPLDPIIGVMVDGTIEEQTSRALKNIGALLSAAGLTYRHVAKTTVFLADMNDFLAMNVIYQTFFAAPYPARSTVQAARLPRDARIEIDAIASFDA